MLVYLKGLHPAWLVVLSKLSAHNIAAQTAVESTLGCRRLEAAEFDALKNKVNHVEINTIGISETEDFQAYKGEGLVNKATYLITSDGSSYAFIIAPTDQTTYTKPSQSVVKMTFSNAKDVIMLMPALKQGMDSVYCSTTQSSNDDLKTTQIDLYDVDV